jgi:hypothetical protein
MGKFHARECPCCHAADDDILHADDSDGDDEDDGIYYVLCLVCGMTGPECDSVLVAHREWNRLPRRSDNGKHPEPYDPYVEDGDEEEESLPEVSVSKPKPKPKPSNPKNDSPWSAARVNKTVEKMAQRKSKK